MNDLTMAQVWGLVFLHLGGIAVVAAYCAAGAALFPRKGARAAEALARRAWLAVLIGILISIPWVVAALVLMQRGGRIGLVGAVIGIAWLLLGLFGCSAIAQRIGAGTADDHFAPAGGRAAFRGGAMLALIWALPVAGWYAILPLSLATGVGCAILSMRRDTNPD